MFRFIKFFKTLLPTIFVAFLIFSPVLVGAELIPNSNQLTPPNAGADIGQQLGAAGGTSGANLGNYQDPRVTTVNMIRGALGFIGLIFFILVLYAGFTWMTAAGNDEKVETAKKLLFRAVIGLIVILCAYSITILVTNFALGTAPESGTGVFIEHVPESQLCGPGTGFACP